MSFLFAVIRLSTVVAVPVGLMHGLVLLDVIPPLMEDYGNSVIGLPLCLVLTIASALVWKRGE